MQDHSALIPSQTDARLPTGRHPPGGIIRSALRRLIAATAALFVIAGGFVAVSPAAAAGAPPTWHLPFESGQSWYSGAPHSSAGVAGGTRGSIDFGPASGANPRVVAVARGTVYKVVCGSRYYLGVDHGNGWKSTYYHLTDMQTALVGKTIEAGTYLGTAGRETPCGGGATFNHVHLTIIRDGAAVDLNGFIFGGYTVRSAATNYYGTWTDKSGAVVVKANGGAACCLRSTTPRVAAQPFGYFDSATPVNGGVLVRGWAIDPATTAPITVQVFSGGVQRATVVAEASRPDVDAAYGRGAKHGYEVVLPSAAAAQGPITVYALTADGKRSITLGSKSVAVKNPIGSLDTINGVGSTDRIVGWALDPDTRGSILIHVYRDGVRVAEATANSSRPDVDAAFGYGAAHGFDITVPAGANGSRYTVYAINYGAGDNPKLASVIRGLTVTSAPSVSGSTVFGATLTAKPGSWSPAGATYTYQWRRDGALISGATSASYVLTLADLGHAISTTVTARIAGAAPGQATSAATAKVTTTPFTAAPAPLITGTTKVGQILTAKPGAWARGPVLVKYQWSRNGTAIVGATSSTYKLVAADAGARITVTVTGTKPGFTTVAKKSTATGAITK